MKKFSSFLSIVLTLSIILGNFTLPVFAYDNVGANSEQVKMESKTLTNTNGTILNKLNSVSKSTSGVSSYSQLIQKEGNILEKSQQIVENRKDYVEGEILVKYKNTKINLNTTSGRTAALSFNNSKSLEKKEDLVKNNISVLRIKDSKTVEQKIAELKNDPNVEYAEPNYRRYPMAISSNDTYKSNLWGLDNTGQIVNTITGTNDADIDAPEAWAINEGTNASVIVAVIDSGVAYNHPDLLGNMWNGASCKDENGNALGGCNHGYDFEDSDKTPLPTTSSHGTHIAGTIAAIKNNNKGIIGVAPNAKIMAIKSSLTVSNIIKSIDFAIQNGAKVINASYADNTFSQFEYDAINSFKTYGGIFVAAAGNQSTNNESIHSYPSDYNLDNIISVAATDQNDALSTFSNYGITSVDVGAPGGEHPNPDNGVIYSTIPLETATLFERFESVTPPTVPSGWVKGGISNNWGTYALDDGSFWGKVLYGDLAYPYSNNANTTITSPTYNLSSGGANIDFYTKCDTEYITNGWADYMQLEYSSDGVNFFVPPDPYFGDSGDGFRWDEPTLDILNGEDPLDSTGGALFHYKNISIPTQYLTSNFKFRFRWVTNSSDNSYDGCLVDDVKITKFSDGSDEHYGYMDGTSMAAPHVAGLAALIEGYNPNLALAQVKNIILTTGDSLNSLNGKTTTGKRINAQKALQAANPAKAITAFTIPSQVGTTTINESSKTISVTMPYGTVITALVPTFTITGSSVTVGATPQVSATTSNDFTSPVTYTVTAADGSTQNYVITVTFTPNPAKAITAFSFANQSATGVINESAKTVAVTIPFGTSKTALVASFAITGASVKIGSTTQTSGVTSNNFTNPVTYIVTAADTSTQNYVVTVTVASASHIISGTIKYYDGIKLIPNTTVILENGVGEQITTTTTDANGVYQFTNVVDGGNYVVRASKNDNNSGLSSNDQIKIGRHIVGLELFSTIFKTIAGDVNNSGGLTSNDQIKIGRFIVGLDSSLTSGSWKFYSSDSTLTTQNYLNTGLTRTYTNLTVDTPNQDFVGIKMGDVNNSWVNN